MATVKRQSDDTDACNLFPESRDCFHLRIPQHFLDLCDGDLLEALVLGKLCYWANFEYKDLLRRGKKSAPDEVAVRRSLMQLAGDCLGAVHVDTVKNKIRSLERRGYLASERSSSPRSNREQIVARVVNVRLLQERLRAWEDSDSPVRLTRFSRGSLEVKAGGRWVPFGAPKAVSPGGDPTVFHGVPHEISGGDPTVFQGVPHEISGGLSKGLERITSYEVKGFPKGHPGGTPNETALAGGSFEEDRWLVEGVDFGPGSDRFHGSNLDGCSQEDFRQILNLFKLAQEYGYGIQIPASGKRPSETFFAASRILRDYEQRTWTPEFTPAFESAWGLPEPAGGARGWDAVGADLREAFQHDLAQKAAGSRNPGPFLRFLETQVADAGIVSPFWASLVQARRSQSRPSVSAILREQIGQGSTTALLRRFGEASDRPRDSRVFWDRCLAIHQFLTEHRPGIVVHAALVGGWFRRHPITVEELLDQYDLFRIESGAADPGDPGTGWPPAVGEQDWNSFLAWGRGRNAGDAFDLTFRPTQTEEEAEATRKAQEAERCFDRWGTSSEFDEDDAEAAVRQVSPGIRSLSTPMAVHAVRLLQARRACLRNPSGLHLRALALEASRQPVGRITPQEEAPWALLGVTFLDEVREDWTARCPDKLGPPEASLFPNSGT